MPQVIIKRTGSVRRADAAQNTNASLGDEITVTGDQVIVNSEASVTVTYAESEIIVDLAR